MRAGMIAVACGSDKANNSDNPALTPGTGNDRGNDEHRGGPHGALGCNSPTVRETTEG